MGADGESQRSEEKRPVKAPVEKSCRTKIVLHNYDQNLLRIQFVEDF